MRTAILPAAAFLAASAPLCAQPCALAWRQLFVPQDAGTVLYTFQPQVFGIVPFTFSVNGVQEHALVAVGSFSSIGGTPANRLAAWDGHRWTAIPQRGYSFVDGSSLHVIAACDPNGSGSQSLFVAGGPEGSSLPEVGRWNGSSWAQASPSGLSFVHGESLPQEEGWVTGIFALDPDGPGPEPVSLYATQAVYGFQTEQTNSHFYRLVNDAWSPVGDVQERGPIDVVAFDQNGAGARLFATMNEGGSPCVKRLDGETWTTVTSSNVPGNASLAVFQPPGGSTNSHALYVGGSVGSEPYTGRILVLQGSTLVPFVDADGPVYGLQVIDDDGPGPDGPALFVTGTFRHIAGVAAAGVARFSGAAWSALGPGVPANLHFDNPIAVRTLAAFDDDGPGPRRTFLYAGGDFSTAGYAPSRAIARWDGLSWLPPGTAVDNSVHCLLAADDGSGPALYIGGAFLSSDGLRTVGISRYSSQGFSALTSGMNNHVDALALFENRVVAAGKFTTAGSLDRSHIAQWNGATWDALGPGLNGNVDALAVHDDGSGTALYAAGRFTGAGSTPASRIARWNGQAWSPLGAGFDGDVLALASYAGSLYAAGPFTHTGVNSVPGIARWGGGVWHAAGTPPCNITALAVHRGELYAGGSGRAGSHDGLVCVWNGSAWSTPPGLFRSLAQGQAIIAMASFDEDGPGPAEPALYVSGGFSGGSGYLARWDGRAWAAPLNGLDGPVYAFAPFGDAGGVPTLFVGGEFSMTGRQTTWYLATLSGCPSCLANCDGSVTPPVLNAADFWCFFDKFAMGDPYANCDGSTTPPVLNVQDFTCFLEKFSQGCP